jgi:hypothetical protein
MLSLVIVIQKEAWVFYEKREKKKRKKEKKRTNVSLKIKRDSAAQVFLKVFKFLREVYENFPKELSIHHCHSFTPYNHFYPILYLSIYHHLPNSLYTCIS